MEAVGEGLAYRINPPGFSSSVSVPRSSVTAAVPCSYLTKSSLAPPAPMVLKSNALVTAPTNSYLSSDLEVKLPETLIGTVSCVDALGYGVYARFPEQLKGSCIGAMK